MKGRKKKSPEPIEFNRLYLCDNKDLTDRMDPESIDLIFTDPPYVSEPEINGMPMWEWAYLRLANIAGKVLKPSGFLITYAPQAHLSDIMRILETGSTCGVVTNESPRLDYFWIISSLNMSRTTAKAHKWNAICLYKPIIVYQKPPFKSPSKCFVDVLRGKKQKAFHPWQQSIHDVLGVISRFMEPGQVLYDPFACTGTSLKAAKVLGFNFIGAEIDPKAHAVGVRQLAQEALDLSSFGPCQICRDCDDIDHCGSRDPHAGCKQEVETA